jgi:GxxExxY protein
MNTDQRPIRGKHEDLTERIIGVFYDVYNELGHGFLESIYREAMRVALGQAGLRVATEVPIRVIFRGTIIGTFRADLIVEGYVLVELKKCDVLAKEHDAQTLNYLRSTDLEVALLMNFGPQPRFKRFAMDNERKRSMASASIDVGPFAPGGAV